MDIKFSAQWMAIDDPIPAGDFTLDGEDIEVKSVIVDGVTNPNWMLVKEGDKIQLEYYNPKLKKALTYPTTEADAVCILRSELTDEALNAPDNV